jgi:nucleoside-diphosphate-sugar epimerase
MTTIGLIGASGQVGLEVCLYLKTYPDVRPIAVVRSAVSGAMLRRLGVELRVGKLGEPEETAALLRDCDLIVDFSVASGETRDIMAHYRRHLRATLSAAKPSARYVFISTINALGMNAQFVRPKHYWLPHSIYALTKRKAERLAFQLGRQQGREVHVFRLAHVHGLLQRVSHETAELLRQWHGPFEYPDAPAHIIFCHSIAEALVQVAAGQVRPACHTLVAEPAWTWRELLEHFAEPMARPEVILRPVASLGMMSRLRQQVMDWGRALTMRYKETLRANLLQWFPDLERKFQARFYLSRARAEIQAQASAVVYRAEGLHEGRIPGQRLASLSDCRVTMPDRARQVQAMLDQLPRGSVHSTRADA